MSRGKPSAKPPRAVVIGIGSVLGGDDAVGLLVARCIKERLPENAVSVEMTGDSTILVDHFEAAETAVIVDAVRSAGRPGTVHRIDGITLDSLRSFRGRTTHDLDLVKAIELARALSRVPGRLVIFGVEGKNFTRGEEISPEVERAIPEIVDRILDELRTP